MSIPGMVVLTCTQVFAAYLHSCYLALTEGQTLCVMTKEFSRCFFFFQMQDMASFIQLISQAWGKSTQQQDGSIPCLASL